MISRSDIEAAADRIRATYGVTPGMHLRRRGARLDAPFR